MSSVGVWSAAGLDAYSPFGISFDSSGHDWFDPGMTAARVPEQARMQFLAVASTAQGLCLSVRKRMIVIASGGGLPNATLASAPLLESAYSVPISVNRTRDVSVVLRAMVNVPTSGLPPGQSLWAVDQTSVLFVPAAA